MSEIILYTSPYGARQVEVNCENGGFCQTQRRKAEQFGVCVPTINGHLGSILESRELARRATIRKFRIVQVEGWYE